MLVALLRAFADLSHPTLRRVVVLGLSIALASFVVVWSGVAFTLAHTSLFEWHALDWLIDLLGAVAVLVLSWLLFPAVVTIVMGLFLERIAAAVESLHYPGQGPPRRTPVIETVLATMRLMGLTILLNLLALPVYILAPGLNFFVFLGLNGYLFGREYFEVVALRRLDMHAIQAARSRYSGRIFLAGAVIAGLFAIPLANLVAPLIATAFMVHMFEGVREGTPPPAA